MLYFTIYIHFCIDSYQKSFLRTMQYLTYWQPELFIKPHTLPGRRCWQQPIASFGGARRAIPSCPGLLLLVLIPPLAELGSLAILKKANRSILQVQIQVQIHFSGLNMHPLGSPRKVRPTLALPHRSRTAVFLAGEELQREWNCPSKAVLCTNKIKLSAWGKHAPQKA